MFTLLNSVLLIVLLFQVSKLRRDVWEIECFKPKKK